MNADHNSAAPTHWTRRAAMAGFIGSGLALAGCAQSSYRVRYRLTARVRAHGKVHQASTVHEYRYRDSISWLGSMDAVRSNTFGDALVFVIDGRLIVFTLKACRSNPRNGERHFDGPAWALPNLMWSRDSSVFAGIFGRTIASPITVAPRQMPLIVTFDDPADRRSARSLDPGNLSGLFGPGAGVESLVATPTRERVTRGNVERYLPWAKESGAVGQARLDDAHINIDPYDLSYGDW